MSQEFNHEEIIARVKKEIEAHFASKPKDAAYQPPECRAGQPAAAYAGNVAGCIEHSLLNPDISAEKVLKGCEEARRYLFANVCVTPYFVSRAAEALRGTSVAVCAPVGFPHGAASLAAKSAEIRECVMNGARELDIELNIVAMKSGEWDAVRRDLSEMIHVCGGRAKLKAIYEQGLLDDDEKKRALEIIAASGVDFIKISNALTGKAACVEDVAFVRSIVPAQIGIKIDGGIKTIEFARAILGAGASRIGCSASVAIAQGEGAR